MGCFFNPDNSAFQAVLNANIYVDKTDFIEYTNRVIGSIDAFICNRKRYPEAIKDYTGDVLLVDINYDMLIFWNLRYMMQRMKKH